MRLPGLLRARVAPVALPLCRPLATAHGPIALREGCVLELDAGDLAGHADALPLPGFGLESPEALPKGLLLGLEALRRARPPDLAAALDVVETATRDHRCARAALDVALHDLCARAADAPVAELLGAARSRVAVAGLVPDADADAAVREARRLLRAGFGTLKLKVGRAPLAVDVGRVAAVRAAAGPGVRLRLDAHQAWSAGEARRALERLAGSAPEWIEEPLRDASPPALAALRRVSPVPLAADESAGDAGALRALLDASAVDVLVVKPMATGGLRAANRILAVARAAGLRTLVTSFLDSALGGAAALHLAATLPAEAPVAGLATDRLLAEDVATLPPVEGGSRRLPDAPGLGVVPSAERLRALGCGPVQEVALA
ncbi:MAG: mandelate racemase/muconate lactonizing enzyme family protein [Myxococcota bacterium]